LATPILSIKAGYKDARRRPPLDSARRDWLAPKMQSRLRLEKKVKVNKTGSIAGHTDEFIPSSTDAVTNGDFSGGSTGWALCAGWTVSGGVATHVACAAVSVLSQPLTLCAGSAYVVVFKVTARTAGSVALGLCSAAGTARAAAGRYQERLVAGATDASIQVVASADFAGSVTGIEVYQEVPIWAEVIQTIAGQWIGGKQVKEGETATIRIRYRADLTSKHFLHDLGLGKRYRITEFYQRNLDWQTLSCVEIEDV
jgi:hypothetical protein